MIENILIPKFKIPEAEQDVESMFFCKHREMLQIEVIL